MRHAYLTSRHQHTRIPYFTFFKAICVPLLGEVCLPLLGEAFSCIHNSMDLLHTAWLDGFYQFQVLFAAFDLLSFQEGLAERTMGFVRMPAKKKSWAIVHEPFMSVCDTMEDFQ